MVVSSTCPSLELLQALSIAAQDETQYLHGAVLARLFFSLASPHEISFLYLGTVECRNMDKVRGLNLSLNGLRSEHQKRPMVQTAKYLLL